MKKNILMLIILLSFPKMYSSEYYGLIVGYNAKGTRVLKGTCRSYPLNTFIYILERKKELAKYFPQEKIDYLNFKVLGQTDNDDFYFENKPLTSKEVLKDPELLKTYLTNLYFVIRTKEKDLIKDKIFEDSEEIENFISPLMTLVGILETMSENNCTKVSWIAKLY